MDGSKLGGRKMEAEEDEKVLGCGAVSVFHPGGTNFCVMPNPDFAILIMNPDWLAKPVPRVLVA